MMKMIFIDDDPTSIEAAKEELKSKFKDLIVEIRDFDDGRKELATFRPNFVVLDIWKDDPGTGTPEGQDVLDFIWWEHFCPVIVYSANSEIIKAFQRYNHPFIEVVTKGTGSDLEVREAAERFIPHIEALVSAELHVARTYYSAMRYVAPYAFDTFDDPVQITDAIVRGGRRRVAALMDEAPDADTRLASWEKYLCPPVVNNNRLGDILHQDSDDQDDPVSYRVVLTPSCDMVDAGSQTPNVDAVLVAKCCSMSDALDQTRIGKSRRKIKDSRILTQGFYDGFIPFPSLPGKIPTMAADLRDLELIPLADIGDEGQRFIRVASIDSPFRELISWAYLQIAGRPGLPETELEPWIQQILQSIDTNQVVTNP